MKKKHFTFIKGHIISKGAYCFPSVFNEAYFEILHTQEKVYNSSNIEVREWLVLGLITNNLDNENKPVVEKYRLPTKYLAVFAQALVMASYGRKSEIFFPEKDEVVLREDISKWSKCNRLNVIADSGALVLELTHNEQLLKTILFRSGTATVDMMLEQLPLMEVSDKTRKEWNTLSGKESLDII